MKVARTFLFVTFLAASSGSAQEVAAALFSNTASVGETVKLAVTVRGARGAELPQTLTVKGLQINLANRSTQFEMHNFKMSSVLTYTYTVVPEVAGEFTIPSIDVRVEGKTFSTQPMKLLVSGVSPMPQTPTPTQSTGPIPSTTPSTSTNNSEQFFADIIPSKKTAYVGEAVPVELRFYFNTRIGGQVGEFPGGMAGTGFARVQEFSKAVKREQVVNGANYTVFCFQTTIIAVKSGIMSIPEATLEARLQLPAKGLEDLGNVNSDVILKTTPVQIQIMPLPKDAHPVSFSEAVGKFTMEATVSHKITSAGEPVILNVTVYGKENLGAILAPVLTDNEGWQRLSITEHFMSADTLQFSYALIPKRDRSQTPRVAFSYFDPGTAKYETLISPPIAVDAKAIPEPVSPSISPIVDPPNEVSLDLGGGVKVEMLWIPVEGSDGTAMIEIGNFAERNSKEPVHSETISGPFRRTGKGFGYYLGKTEVTEAQWAAVTGQGRKAQTSVTEKTFLEIQSFIETLNSKSGQFAQFPQTRDGSPGVIRLPTEAEWEYAARGGSCPDYSAKDPYKGDIERHEVFAEAGSGGRAKQVASFPPNPLGLHDMLGNAREFVEGSYSVGGRVGGLLLKGGSYLSERQEVRSSARTEQSRTGKDGKPARRPDAGFRLCISADVFTSLGGRAKFFL